MWTSRIDGTPGGVPTERCVDRFQGTRLVFGVRWRTEVGSTDLAFGLNESKTLDSRWLPEGGVSRTAGTRRCRSAGTTQDRIVFGAVLGWCVLMERGWVLDGVRRKPGRTM